MNDGVAVRSMTHPRASWWRRLLWLVKRPRLREAALERVEIDAETVGRHCGPLIPRRGWK